MRSKRGYTLIVLKGMAMGAADVVPGVSGGTIAFITGIYEELLSTIASINLSLVKTLRNNGLKATWNQANGNFLLALLGGIAISVLSLAKLIEWLLENEPIKLWSFFFGLVLASIIFVGRQVTKWGLETFTALLSGAFVAYYITILPPMSTGDAPWFMFLAGMLAICAMILPGISGSFILLLLGAYKTILGAISNYDFLTIGVVGTGAVVGILSFSRVLKWMFEKYKNITIALLTGFLIGSLNKIWPWKLVNKIFIKHQDEPKQEIVNLSETSVLPSDFSLPEIDVFKGEVIGQLPADSQVSAAIPIMVVGFILIFVMEWAANKTAKQ